jgi:acetyl-CoA carboxylase biotin carboxyl carrier protein
MNIDHNKIRKLVKLVEQNGLSELTIEEDGQTVTIKADHSSASAGVHAMPHPASMPGPAPFHENEFVHEEFEDVEVEIPVSTEHFFEIKSPMVGVFYRHPSPDMPPYSEVGDYVELGQTIGLIEAMKVFSEVPTEVAGRVVSLPVENGTLVQQGDVLAIIDTSSTDIPTWE